MLESVRMRKPQYNASEQTVLAPCPECRAVTSFDTRGFGNHSLGVVVLDLYHHYGGTAFSRILWRFFRCNTCSRGGVAKLHDKGHSSTEVLELFHPTVAENVSVPNKVPTDIIREFREAELVASHGAFRAASALLRSVLEKALTKNGYDEVEIEVNDGGKKVKRKSRSLKNRIDAAGDDGVITEARKKRAHDNIRVLGNDILHEEWREVTQEEFEDAHLYSQRILEDLYDDRATVEGILTAKKRPFVPVS
jgi:uncharacterized protein DUF4145